MADLVPGVWTIDPAHSEVAFTIRHMMGKVRGRFGQVEGTIITGSADPADATVLARVAVATLDTNQRERDEHIRTAEILDVATFPYFTFVSTAIEARGSRHVIHGDLTVRGISRGTSFDAEFTGAVDPDHFGLFRMGAEGTTVIDKRDFGIDFNIPLPGGELMLGNRITIAVALEATLTR